MKARSECRTASVLNLLIAILALVPLSHSTPLSSPSSSSASFPLHNRAIVCALSPSLPLPLANPRQKSHTNTPSPHTTENGLQRRPSQRPFPIPTRLHARILRQPRSLLLRVRPWSQLPVRAAAQPPRAHDHMLSRHGRVDAVLGRRRQRLVSLALQLHGCAGEGAARSGTVVRGSGAVEKGYGFGSGRKGE